MDFSRGLTRCVRRASLAMMALVVSGNAGAQQFREIKHAGAGFIGPGNASNPPETATCQRFAYPGSAGFPYRNRSIAIDLGCPPPTVHRIILIDDYSDHGGDSPSIREHGLEIYTSNDNRTYTRHTGKYRLSIRSAKQEGGFDAVQLDGLTITARYIKLHADLPDEKWDFANHDLRKMVRVFQDPDRVMQIAAFSVDRYAAETLPLRVRLKLPRIQPEDAELRIMTGKRGEAADTVLARIPVRRGASRERLIEKALPLGHMSVGPAEVRAIIADGKGNILTEVVAETFVCSSVIRDPGPADVPAPSRPGQAVLLTAPFSVIPHAAGDSDSRELNRQWQTATAGVPDFNTTLPLIVGVHGAPGLRIPLPASGWHAVTVGLVGGDSRVKATLRPDGKPRFCRLDIWGEHRPGTVLGEAFVGCRHLGNSTLEIELVKGAPARIAFVRLLGLSSEETEIAEAAAKPSTARRVIIHSDGFSGFFSGGYDTKEKLERMIDRFTDTAIYSFDWCVGPSSTFTYNTRIGTIFGSNIEKFWRRGDKRAAEAVRTLIAGGNDPLRVVVERAHKRGVRINATLRMNANYGGEPAKAFNGEFYWQHLHCRIVDDKGKPRAHLSYAYREVRDFRLSIIKEAAGYGVDGIHLNFLRHPPFFGYDPPLVEAFLARYGVQPKKCSDDKRWHQLRADIMTSFVRQVRAALDEIGNRTGKRLALSATMEYRNYLEQGLDVERWVKEGLVDLISPGVHGLGGTYFPVKHFAAMVQGTNCRLFPMLECTIKGHDPTPESERGEIVYESQRMTLNRFRARFLELHREGAEGVYPFNGGTAFVNPLSHTDGLRAWEQFEKPLIEWFVEVALPDGVSTETIPR